VYHDVESLKLLRQEQQQRQKKRQKISRFGWRLRSGLRQSGGRFAAVFRRGAEAPLYLRGKGNSKSKSNSRSLRDDKQKNRQKQMQMQRQIQGFFASLRMTTFCL
jgi:hypothetical protein